LIEAIREHHWIDEALPRMCAQAASEPVPESWQSHFLEHPGSRTDTALLAQCRVGAMSMQILARAAARPASAPQPLLSATWHLATELTDNPASVLRLFALGCKYGLPEMPGDLAVLIQTNRPQWIRESDYESSRKTLLDVFALRSDCPREPGLARTWLAEHSEMLRFNPDTQRYELR
jgi:hypothetical protein